MYKGLIRPLLFALPPEAAHRFSFAALRLLLSLAPIRWLFRRAFCLPGTRHAVEQMGLRFPNPLGLAAGFDKDGLLAEKWECLGFGFAELGTVTPRPQPGNPLPRLFRLPADQALINRMGFNNAGADALASRLSRIRRRNIVLGINIGKNKDTPAEQAADDYLYCFEKLYPWADYFVVNVSSPNTPGLRALQEKGPLTEILSRLQAANQAQSQPRPLLLKIAPDLSEEQLDDVLSVALATGLAGIVATNTTLDRSCLRTPTASVEAMGPGGLSGPPLRERASEVICYLHARSGGRLLIIGAGGIQSPEDLQEKKRAGASLFQSYTGFVYEGPRFARKLLSR
jgi:dihydroorotate dehydrogenase